MTVDPGAVHDPGMFNRSCAVERRATVDDGYGNARGAWAALVTVWGALRFAAARESGGPGAPEATDGASLLTPLTDDAAQIAADDRVIIDGQTWRVAGAPRVDPPGGGALRVPLQAWSGG